MSENQSLAKVDRLRSKLESLSPHERKLMKARILGYGDRLPPTIDEFLDSPYYMGETYGKILYPFWREFLRKLYPDEITTSNTMIVLSLALGTGKTSVSVVMAAYTLCRYLHMKDLTYAGVNDESKPTILLFNHTSSNKAYQECIKPMKDAMSQSVFFSSKAYPYHHKFKIVGDSLRSNKAVGTNLIFASFSEVNFVNAKKMRARMNTIINRYTNRFMKLDGFLGNIILDSSPAGTDSLVEDFLRKTPFDIKIIRAAVWEVKGFLGGFSKETFDVYSGDATHKPYIVSEKNPLHDTYDPDKLLHVPLNLYRQFENDLLLALQDAAGLSVSITGVFIRNRDLIRSAFALRMSYPERIVVDLFDDEDSLIGYFPNITDILPQDRRIALHLDLGVTGDITGLSAGYYDGDYVDNEELKITKPLIKIPFTIGIGRKKNQETCITKITEFIIWLSTIFEIWVTMDTFQTRNMKQDLERKSIKCDWLSVDRTADPYNYLKLAIYEQTVQGVNLERLLKELGELKLVKNKIDHPSEGSKDLADSVCGVAYNIYKHIGWFAKMPTYLIKLMAQERLADLYGKENAQSKMNAKVMKLTEYSDDDDF